MPQPHPGAYLGSWVQPPPRLPGGHLWSLSRTLVSLCYLHTMCYTGNRTEGPIILTLHLGHISVGPHLGTTTDGLNCLEGGETQSQRAHPALRPMSVWASEWDGGLYAPTIVEEAGLHGVSVLNGGGKTI